MSNIHPDFSTKPRGFKLRTRLAGWLEAYILPLGLFVLLTGMFWSGDRALYHRLFYALVAFPAFIAAIVRPTLLRDLADSVIGLPFLVFSAFTLLSIFWSDSDDGVDSLIKRPLYVALLFVAAIAVRQLQPIRGRQVLLAALATSVITGVVYLTLFAPAYGPGARLSGYGALYNPLLTSHVFGFFLAIAIAAWVERRQAFPLPIVAATMVLGMVIVATGSRTPLVGITATVLWLAALSGDRRGVIAAAALVGTGLLVASLWPDLLTDRGTSYRPEIWSDTLRQISEKPIFGHGYDHPLEIYLEGIADAFRDPHNMILAVLYYGGLVGLALWVWLYGAAVLACWRQRHDPAVFICSATLIYGLAASMTEGGAFLSRPKEHWFLIWIPFALLAATTLKSKHDGRLSRQE
ncbi:O-antigen ligase family protein [Aromatoleum diolicum]|uniref:O-antigen ligase family protein n=1 Tax=Aromatoleum diolicum TaxID=75796 RepID=UPI001B7D0281